jgi:hypothetical protein
LLVVLSTHWAQPHPQTVDALPFPFHNDKQENPGQNGPEIGMAPEPNSIEQAVARALRDNLESLQRTSEALNQAINDVVAACASSRPTNALPPMLRAQTASAALSASLEVLSRFVAMALQPGPRSPFEEKITQAIGSFDQEAAPPPVRPVTPPPEPQPAAPVPVEPPAYDLEPTAEPPAPVELEVSDVAVASDSAFDTNQLTPEEQELHRRANRVAKVSMQDIKMLRPEQVKLGREHRDICTRLKDDIEKAHREYDRRFRPIMDHPVDYFYRWMVEILADGDSSALGEYPYATTSKSR